MITYLPDLSALEIIHLLRAETTAAYGAPSLNIATEKEYIKEEDFDRLSYGIEEDAAVDHVTSIARLTVEPWVEFGYWLLEVTVERVLGPIHRSQQRDLIRRNMTLDDFEEELRNPGQKQVSVRLSVETADVKADFDQWLAETRRRHSRKAGARES